MTVKLIASTALSIPVDYEMEPDEDATPAEDLIEIAGRTCYLSFNKPNPKTRKNADYISHILDVGHSSIFEHASATFEVTNVSRNLLIELSRHRHISLSVVSTRYVDVSEFKVITPPALRSVFGDSRPLNWFEKGQYLAKVEELIADGYSRKEAREAAVADLPGNLETRFIITANLRAWRDVLSKRWDKAANAEIREWAGEVLTELRKIAPSVFKDFPDEL